MLTSVWGVSPDQFCQPPDGSSGAEIHHWLRRLKAVSSFLQWSITEGAGKHSMLTRSIQKESTSLTAPRTSHGRHLFTALLAPADLHGPASHDLGGSDSITITKWRVEKRCNALR